MVLTTTTISEIKTAVLSELNTQFTHMAFGDGNTAEDASDTALDNELVTKARQEVVTLGNSFIMSGFLGAGEQNGETIREVGAKDGASGNLQSRKVITDKSKTALNELWVDDEVAITVTQS